MQRTLQAELGSATVLTIAHRLNTIVHCDKVIVLDAGEIVEEGPPDELRAIPNGHFAQLWERSR